MQLLLWPMALLRPPTSRLGASMNTAVAPTLKPQRFGPDRRIELGGCTCEVVSGAS